jgi:hypothetical protein
MRSLPADLCQRPHSLVRPILGEWDFVEMPGKQQGRPNGKDLGRRFWDGQRVEEVIGLITIPILVDICRVGSYYFDDAYHSYHYSTNIKDGSFILLHRS